MSTSTLFPEDDGGDGGGPSLQSVNVDRVDAAGARARAQASQAVVSTSEALH